MEYIGVVNVFLSVATRALFHKIGLTTYFMKQGSEYLYYTVRVRQICPLATILLEISATAQCNLF